MIEIPIDDGTINILLSDGALKIDLKPFVKNANQKLTQACSRYTDELDAIFAATEGTFKDSVFHIKPTMVEFTIYSTY